MWASEAALASRRLILRSAVAVGCAAASLVPGGSALAQPLPEVTEDDIARVRRQHRMPSDAELARIPVPGAPRIDALPQPLTQSTVDLEALARGFDNPADGPAFAAGSGPSLLIFVSFAMPEATLTRLVDQASRAGATLVLRGLVDGSLRETVERMQRLVGTRRVAVQIDPQAFDRYSVQRTPSFVIVRGGAASQPCGTGSCIAGDQYLLAAGDVSLGYALEHFRRSAPRMAGEASMFLQRMKGVAR